jgi:type II secretory pathway component PulF
MGRFARILGLCLNAGLSLIDALELAGQSAGRSMLRRDATRMVEQVRAGGQIKHVLATCDYIPPFTRRMLASGEEAGELTRMCDVVARHYERDASTLAKNVSTVIEPVLIVLIAAVVLTVALAIFLPMWDMVTLLG